MWTGYSEGTDVLCKSCKLNTPDKEAKEQSYTEL